VNNAALTITGLQKGQGITTGTCAQAVAKAAGLMLFTQKQIDSVDVDIPSGKTLTLKILDPKINIDRANCAIEKDSGDDPDATDGIKICAEVKFSKGKGITITGAEGVGMVTKPGLAVKVGEYAINPVPRRMIRQEIERLMAVNQLILRGRGLEVIISVPGGREIAKQTFNSRIGVVDGISILGTTGIVEPKSLEAYKASLALQLGVLKAAGYPRAVLVLGYVGEKFCKEVLGLKEDAIIKIGDHVGFMLKQCAKKKIKEVLLIGHIGKLIKVANGQFNTHCSSGDNRMSSIARYAGLYGADKKTIGHVLNAATAEATVEILRKAGLAKIFEKIAQDVSAKAREFVNNKVKVDCIILSLDGKVLGSS